MDHHIVVHLVIWHLKLNFCSVVEGKKCFDLNSVCLCHKSHHINNINGMSTLQLCTQAHSPIKVSAFQFRFGLKF